MGLSQKLCHHTLCKGKNCTRRASAEANVGQTSHMTVGRVRELPVHDELGAMFIVESSDLHLHGHYVRLSFHKTQDAQRH